MISATYAISASLIVATQVLFLQGRLTAQSQTLLWALTFFVASAAASAGYLTVSEIFPLEMRALAIAIFYAVGTAIGGLGAPVLFGVLLDAQSRVALVWGYLAGAGLMLAAAAIEWTIGVDSEQKSLEDVATPLSAESRRHGCPEESHPPRRAKMRQERACTPAPVYRKQALISSSDSCFCDRPRAFVVLATMAVGPGFGSHGRS
jgi:MFS family permease